MWPILPGKFYCLELGHVKRVSLTAGLHPNFCAVKKQKIPRRKTYGNACYACYRKFESRYHSDISNSSRRRVRVLVQTPTVLFIIVVEAFLSFGVFPRFAEQCLMSLISCSKASDTLGDFIRSLRRIWSTAGDFRRFAANFKRYLTRQRLAIFDRLSPSRERALLAIFAGDQNSRV